MISFVVLQENPLDFISKNCSRKFSKDSFQNWSINSIGKSFRILSKDSFRKSSMTCFRFSYLLTYSGVNYRNSRFFQKKIYSTIVLENLSCISSKIPFWICSRIPSGVLPKNLPRISWVIWQAIPSGNHKLRFKKSLLEFLQFFSKFIKQLILKCPRKPFHRCF